MKRLLLHPRGIYVVTALVGAAAGLAVALGVTPWLYLPLLLVAFVAGIAHSRWERRQAPTPDPRRSRARYVDDGLVRRPQD